MKEIKLNNGFVALVDDEDFEYINQWKWSVKHWRHAHYAHRKKGWPIQHTIYMHRQIMESRNWKMIDHIDGDGLNNQKSNLRECDAAQNGHNSRVRKHSKTGYKNVHYDGREGRVKRYEAYISIEGKRTHIGYYLTPEEAARAFDEVAKVQHGEFAKLNFP